MVASARSRELRARAGRVRIDVELDGAPADWAPARGRRRAASGGAARFRGSREVEADPAALLVGPRSRRARWATSRFGPPTLTELFVEAVQR